MARILKLRTTSRLRLAQPRVVEGVTFWQRIEYPEIPPQPDDFTVPVEPDTRLDTLAVRYYEAAQWQWVIAVRNDIDEWPADLARFQELTIPSPAYVLNVLPKTFIS